MTVVLDPASTAAVCLTLAAAACGAGAERPAAARSDGGARPSPAAFVQGFYDAYVPTTLRDGGGPAWAHLPPAHAADVAPELRRALQADAQAQAHADEIVGLDFDPFVGGQDPCERYVAGAARPLGAHVAVDVYGVCQGARHPRPDVTAEVALTADGWQLVNVRYGSGDDLWQSLRSAARDRATTTALAPTAP